MGFELPVIVKQVGMQKERLQLDINRLQVMLEHYSSSISDLEQMDVSFKVFLI